MTGKTADEIPTWINEGLARDQEDTMISVFRENYKGKVILAAKGYEFNRIQTFQKETEEMAWLERVLVSYSPAHANQQSMGLDNRLAKAQEKIEALTPPRGRGRHQIIDEAELITAINKILKAQKVEGLLKITYEKQVDQTEKYIGKGRGAANREKTVVEKVRYQIISVEREDEKITDEKKTIRLESICNKL